MSNYYADSTIHQQLLRDADPDEAAAQQHELEQQQQQQQVPLQDDEAAAAAAMPVATEAAQAAASDGAAPLTASEVPCRQSTPSPALSRSGSHHSSSSLSLTTGGSGAAVPPLSFAGLSSVGGGPLSSTSAQQSASGGGVRPEWEPSAGDYQAAAQSLVGAAVAAAALVDPKPLPPRRILLGVCAMDKKTRSKPMTQILDRLRAYGEFEIIIFGDRLILDDSRGVAEWPTVHCLISFTSKGFPLAKVIEYVRLRKPFCVNDIPSQSVLEDRHTIYRILEKTGIPTPHHLYVDRTNKPETKVVEHPDWIEIDGLRMDKPIVEKPYDGEDHNIYIYYSSKQGGGSRRLFRKIGNRSSRFYPGVNRLRTDGNFIYESLLLQGKDLKVYTIGPGYAHGEMRKCWATGTQLLMHDGRTRAVEDIRAGDALMGDDGQRRVVQAHTVHSGVAPLFRVQLHNSGRTPFLCNGAHILVLCLSQRPFIHVDELGMYAVVEWALGADGGPARSNVTRSKAEAEKQLAAHCLSWRPLVFEVSTAAYMSWPLWRRSAVTMFQPEVPVSYAALPEGQSLQARLSTILKRTVTATEVRQTAWVLGVWLTDESDPAHSSAAVVRELEAWNTAVSDDHDASTTGNIAVHRVDCAPVLRQLVQSYSMHKHKCMPHALITDSLAVRESLFAGVIDGGDAWRAEKDAGRFGFASKQRDIAEGVVHLARGLGFACSGFEQTKHRCSGSDEVVPVWSFHIGGDVERVAPWMKLCKPDTLALRSSTHHHDSFTISPAGEGTFHGFQLDGNGRCLLGDFVVTHNSPVVDGVVARDPDQKELRLLTKLTEEERDIARKICVAFKQNITGFDIIRTAEKSYVIDVNGWSFVKGNLRYYDKCWGLGTRLLRFDGGEIAVEDVLLAVERGETVRLMGPDNCPRTVQPGSLLRGHTALDADRWENTPPELREDHSPPAMYRIESAIPGRMVWTCNADHILVLQCDLPPYLHSDNGKPAVAWVELDAESGQAVVRTEVFATAEEAAAVHAAKLASHAPVEYEISVKDFLASPLVLRDAAQMFQPPQVQFEALPAERTLRGRMEAAFDRPVSDAQVERTAWLLGVWLMDGGRKSQAALSSPIVPDCAAVTMAAEAWFSDVYGVPLASGLLHDTEQEEASSLWTPAGSVCLGPLFTRLLRSYSLLGNKQPVLPADLLRESSSVRRALLAGLIDGDGHYCPEQQVYAVAAKDRSSLLQVIRLARSLGLTTGDIKQSSSVTDESEHGGQQHITIGAANLHEVVQPVLVHKRCPMPTDLSGHKVLNTGEHFGRSAKFSITQLDHAPYYGFRVDGDGRVLLADFVVSHNCARIMRKMCLMSFKGREALKLPRQLEFLPIPGEKQTMPAAAALPPTTPTTAGGYSSSGGALGVLPLPASSAASLLLLSAEEDKPDFPRSVTGVNVGTATPSSKGRSSPAHARTASKEQREREQREREQRERDREKAREREEKEAAAAAAAAAAATNKADTNTTAPSAPESVMSVLSTPAPRLELERTDSSIVTDPAAVAAAAASSSTPSGAMVAALNFGSFSLDASASTPSSLNSTGGGGAGSSLTSPSPLSLLSSPSNPRGLGVTLSSNVIQDCDNNDILLGLVAMFRHADRTPKQKVKLKTKSQTLMALFDEQLKNWEKEQSKNQEQQAQMQQETTTPAHQRASSIKAKSKSSQGGTSGGGEKQSSQSGAAHSKAPSTGGDKFDGKEKSDKSAASAKDISAKENTGAATVTAASGAPAAASVSSGAAPSSSPSAVTAAASSSASAAAAPPSSSSAGAGAASSSSSASAAGSSTAAPAPTPAAAATSKKEKEFVYKDLKYKKKGELVAIREAIKVLLLKEQLREKRKKKLKIAQDAAEAAAAEAAAAAAAAAAAEAKDEEPVAASGATAAAAGEKTATSSAASSLAPSPSAVAAAAASAVRAAQAAEWSEDEADLSAAASAGSPLAVVSESPPSAAAGGAISDSNPDEMLEAAIALEKEQQLKRDAEKDPDYMAKLFQIGQVLEKGYGGVKVQLKPKKTEKGKDGKERVVQALLIVKWGGEMTHAGVGQARQYAAAFWDDMIPPPPMPSNPNSGTASAGAAGTGAAGPNGGGSNKPGGATTGETKGGSSSGAGGGGKGDNASTTSNTKLSITSANHTSALADLANSNANKEPDTPTAAPLQAQTQPPPLPGATPAESDAKDGAAKTGESSSASASSDASASDASASAAANASADSSGDAADGSSEFAFDHNSSLTQSSRAKLKSQLTAARVSNQRAATIEAIPEMPAPGTEAVGAATPSKPAEGGKGARRGTVTTPPPAVAYIALNAKESAGSNNPAPSPVTPSISSRKMSRTGSNLLALTQSQTSAASTAAAGSGEAAAGPLMSPPGSNVSSTQAASSAGVAGGVTARRDGGGGAPDSGEERMSLFRKQRLAFFSGLQVYSSDEARVVASSQAFYQSTFEYAHGLSDMSPDQARDWPRDRDEKKKVSQIKEWIEASKRTHIHHDKDVQLYLDDTGMVADAMARAKDGVKFILLSQQALTPAQVTRHMLATEQMARATSEAERADILKEEEEQLRQARAEAETREREEKEQAHLQRKQQLEEEAMEKLMDRLAELEEDGMHLERQLALMSANIKAILKQQESTAAGGAGDPLPPVQPYTAAGSLAAHVSSCSDPQVVVELEALLAKIYNKLLETAQGKKKKESRVLQMAAAPSSAAETTDLMTGADKLTGAAASATGATATASIPAPKGKKLVSPPTPPSISPPPSPSSFGATSLTEWTVRCLRWVGKPRNTLMKLYDLLLQLQQQIHSKCEWAVKEHAAAAAAAEKAAAAAAAAAAEGGADPSPHADGPPAAALPNRKLSGTGAALLEGVKGAQSSHSSSAPPSSSSAAEKAAASTEFEYVLSDGAVEYTFEDGDEEIVGRNTNFKLRRRAQPARFGTNYLLCHKETLFLMKARWDSLIAAFYDPVKDTIDPTKLPDLYDCIKYDVLHNAEFLSDIRPLYSAIKRVADFVVPNEYGLLRKDKWLIGVGIGRPLLKRMIGQLESALSPRCPSRVTLYFSSESHIHALRNVLLLSGLACNRTVATTLDAIELNYLSHAVFRLYEDVSRPLDDPLRYYVNVQFSPGAALDPFIFCESGHTLPVSRPVPVNGRVPFHLFKQIFAGEISDAQPPRGFTQPWITQQQQRQTGGHAQQQQPSTPAAAAAAAAAGATNQSAGPSPRR